MKKTIKYIKNDKDILNELDTYLNTQNLTETQREKYRSIIKDEYANIKYEIEEEAISENTATVKVKITVKDLYGATQSAEDDLLNNPNDFYTDGIYDSSKYVDYKLNIMENYDKTVDYIIYFSLIKSDGVWNINDLDEVTLEKIHGIYNYDNE